MLPAASVAQDYPTRPIRVIATSSAGGTSDIFMRALADELHRSLGQPFIVENRPGGAFNIGARACAEAAPDGYTLCIIPGEPLVFNQFLSRTWHSIRRTDSSLSPSCSSSRRHWW
jgi:tripartite-type tricarboxylate transporter receptor subunit TctC